MSSERLPSVDRDSYIISMLALQSAIFRYDDDRYAKVITAIEAAWWISAAATACGHAKDGDILQGFYWVRNKGIHETGLAVDAAEAMGSQGAPPDPDYFNSSGIWQPAPEAARMGGDSGNVDAYAAHLEGNDVQRTMRQAHAKLRGFLPEVGNHDR